jgi:hypothetical protein
MKKQSKDYSGKAFFVGVSCLLSFFSEEFWDSFSAQVVLCIVVFVVLFGEHLWEWLKSKL